MIVNIAMWRALVVPLNFCFIVIKISPIPVSLTPTNTVVSLHYLISKAIIRSIPTRN